jgi:MFS family permease
MRKGNRFQSFRLALSQRDFRLLLTSLAVSTAGDWFSSVALIVYVFDRTDSAGWVAAATIGRLAPYVIFGPIAGELADRLDRRRLLITADIARAVLMAGLAVVAAGSGGPGLALAFAFASATAGTPYVPAVTAMTPTVVPETALTAANALAGTLNYLALILGPALGTIALIFGSPALAFALNAATFAGSAVAVALMKSREIRRTAPEATPVLRRAAEGLKPLARSGETAVLAGFFVGQALIYGLESVLLVLAAESLLGMGASGYGWLLASIGVGGLAAALLSSHLIEVRTPTLLLAAGMFAVGLPLASLAVIQEPWVAYIVLPLDGAGTLLTEVLAITALQRSLRADLIGRAFAAMDALAFGAVILGSFLAPVMIEAFGLKLSLVIAGGIGPLATILVAPWLRNVDRTARARIEALRPTVEILARNEIFQGAPRASLEMLAATLRGVGAMPGDVIVREGEEADEFFVVVEGELQATCDDGRILATFQRGDHFGEIGILQGIPRTASVSAVTPCRLFGISAADFLGVVNKSPTVRGAMMTLASSRLALREEPARKGSRA